MGFICLLFPAIIFCYVRNKLSDYKFENRWNEIAHTIFEYVCGNILINTIIILLRIILKHRTDNILDALNRNNGMAIKYIILAVCISIAIPYIERFAKNRLLIKCEYDVKVKQLTAIQKRMIVYGYALIMALLHFVRIFDNSFWGDEGIVVNIARTASWNEMLSSVARNGHTPFHYAFAWISIRIFGESGLVYHLSSILPYFIIIIITALLVRRWFGNKTSLILLTLSTLLDCAVTYNLEIRMYAWCELFVFMTYLMAYRFYKTKANKYYILMPLFAIGAVYSHYFALASIGLIYVILFIYILKNETKNIWKVICSGGSILVLFMPWLFLAKKIKGGVVSNYGIGGVSWHDCIEFIFHSKYSLALLAFFFVATAFAFAYDLGIISFENREKNKRLIKISIISGKWKINEEWIWIISGIVGVFGTIVAAKLFSSLFYPIICLRYLYVSYIIIWLIFAVVLSKCKFSRLWTILLIVFIFVSCLPNYYNTLKTERTNNTRLEKTLEATTSEIDENDFIYTDMVHFAWTVEKVYYPNTPNCLFGQEKWWGPAELPKLDSEREYWLFLSKPISDEITQNLNAQKCSAKLVVNNGYIGVGNVWIYRIVNEGME